MKVSSIAIATIALLSGALAAPATKHISDNDMDSIKDALAQINQALAILKQPNSDFSGGSPLNSVNGLSQYFTNMQTALQKLSSGATTGDGHLGYHLPILLD